MSRLLDDSDELYSKTEGNYLFYPPEFCSENRLENN
jgi:hypothetical protein